MNSPDWQALYEQVCNHARQTAVLASIEALLGWDERTMMPPQGAQYRAEQIRLLAGLLHSRRTDPQWGEQLARLAESPLMADPLSDQAVTIRRLKRQYDKDVRLPQRLVEELAQTASLAQHVWQQARRNNDFKAFLPWLEKTFQLKREQAEAVGYPECRYDALLDDFEPETRTSQVAQVLIELRDRLVPLIGRILGSRRKPDSSLLRRYYPRQAQEAFGRQVAETIGFDFTAGRLDVTVHPFCSSIGPRDCRITTRYNEHRFQDAFFGILHEAGHGLYDQGLREDQYGLPLGEAVSLGIHESQSRLWENVVGRSLAFWRYFFPKAQEFFPQALGDVSLEAFYFAINEVRPSLIRVEADEATYNLHILIRFELEQALLEGDLRAADAPGAWNEKYRQYLGITPPDDTQGVLQDIHWSAGLVGYFPTYALGNLYATQLFQQAQAELGDLSEAFERGEFRPLLDWLRTKIHQQGQRYLAPELIQQVTGRPLSSQPLLEHLEAKFLPLYES
ncbi:MAG: carboxypeptidase M32 [Thermoguttaceae bacterium]|nr:carboxypeptidase M32 [Thermoguttaceae bacterium]MDW8039756.1 carboxypeptidase M32 [Thermoguttaceae bacterium]